jgi:hypothetical protein
MKGVKFSWGGLDRPEVVQPQGDRGYGLGLRLICKGSGHESDSYDGQEQSVHGKPHSDVGGEPSR